VWAMNLDGSNVTQLYASAGGAVGRPLWSPDGSKIAFYGQAGGKEGLCVMEADGSNFHVAYEKNGRDFSWTADGRLLFIGGTTNTATFIVVNPDGTNPQTLATIFHYHPLSSPVLTPDGLRLLYVDQDLGIYQITVATGENKRLFDPWNNDYYHLALSPDGSQIALVSSSRLFIAKSDGTSLRVVHRAANYGYVLAPQFSPDGTSIIFAMGDSGSTQDGSSDFELYTIKTDGTDLRQITAL
jgi:Tol biopolymer transport system component